MSDKTEMKTHDDIVDSLFEQLAYLDKLPDFNESCTTLYIFEAIQTIKSLRTRIAELTKGEPVAWRHKDYPTEIRRTLEDFKFDYVDDSLAVPLFLSAPSIEGYVLVPIEPTEKMIKAAIPVIAKFKSIHDVYHAMIEASKP